MDERRCRHDMMMMSILFCICLDVYLLVFLTTWKGQRCLYLNMNNLCEVSIISIRVTAQRYASSAEEADVR